MAVIEKVVTVSYIKELVEKQAKTHREVSEILRQSPPSKVPPSVFSFSITNGKIEKQKMPTR